MPKRCEIPESTPKRVLKVVEGVSPTNVVSKGGGVEEGGQGGKELKANCYPKSS